MSQRIIDVDAAGILTPPIKAKIGGEVYTLPGDIPAPLYAQLIATQTDGVDAGPGNTRRLYDELLVMFREHQPDLERLPIGIREMTNVIGFIYGSHPDDDAAAGDADGDPTLSTPKTTRRKPRAKSAS